MTKRLRLILLVLLGGLLLVPAVMRRLGRASVASIESPDVDSVSRFGFRLTESAKAAGIDFVHRAPTLDPKLEHIMPQVASMGAAVSVADYDRDGFLDFYVTTSGEGASNRLYRNRGDGTFEDVAEALGLADVNRGEDGASMGSVWGDYDNDGFEDLLLYRWGKQALYRNEGGRSFVDVSREAGVPEWANVNAAIWLDYDRDGRLDFFLGGYYPETVNLFQLRDTKMMPESFEYARNGGRNYLYRNLGEGRFEEVAEKAGVNSRRWTLAVVAADFRETGYPDLYVANDYGVSELFLNEGGRFREVGRESRLGLAPKSGMNASVGDVLNQGRFAIYQSNISEPGILLQGNNLWMPAATEGGVPTFENLAGALGVELGGWSFGAQFGDLNNDGALDLYLVNGYVSASQEESYWYDFAKVAGGHEVVIEDAKNWPPMKSRSLGGYQPKKVWVNDGAGQFVDAAPVVGVTDRFDGRAVALADFQNRGVLDVVVANQNGPLLLYRNEVADGRDWIAFELEGGCQTPAGAASGEACTNRSAIGASVTLFWSGGKQVQEVSGGSGFCSQNQRRLHFGLGSLGEGAKVEKALVRWPSGKTQEMTELETNRLHAVKEPS
jgi:hypothetical protein